MGKHTVAVSLAGEDTGVGNVEGVKALTVIKGPPALDAKAIIPDISGISEEGTAATILEYAAFEVSSNSPIKFNASESDTTVGSNYLTAVVRASASSCEIEVKFALCTALTTKVSAVKYIMSFQALPGSNPTGLIILVYELLMIDPVQLELGIPRVQFSRFGA